MAAGLETDDSIDVPETALHALDLAISDGATTLISAAILLAHGGDLRPQDLFVAALTLGYADPDTPVIPGSTVLSSGVASDRPVADSWLYEWFVERVGAGTVNQFILAEVSDTFPVPLLPDRRGLIWPRAEKFAPTVNLSADAGALLGRASQFAWRTIVDHRYGVRHIVASLILPDANGRNAGLERLVSRRFKIALTDASALIGANASRGEEPPDTIKVWEQIVESPPPTPMPGQDTSTKQSSGPGDPPPPHPQPRLPRSSPRRSRPSAPPPALPIITLSGFTSDGLAAGNADPLGINPDVRAFARLVCLEQATPPLSICLFGEWGSGKSTFMERLQREIARLTKAKPVQGARAIPRPDDDPKFVENIVQIKFNAWHFADASLWASLTAVFFDQLRRGGYDGGRASDYQELIGKVASRVRSLEADAVSALEKVEDAQRNSNAAHKALDTAEKQLAANDLTLAWTQLQEDFEKLRSENEGELREIGRRVYRDDLSNDVKAFAAAVAEAASTPGRVALIGRVLVSGGLPTILSVVAIMLIACIGIALPTIDPTSSATWFQHIAAWGTGILAALGALWQASKAAKPILDGAWKYAKAVENARAKLALEIEEKRREAKEAAAKLKAAETTLASARAPLSVYRDGMPADSPSTILRYFLFEDGDVRDYDKQVGIVSRARRSFEQLNSIVTTTRISRKAAEAKRARGETLKPEEQVLLAPTDGGGFLVPDRIVLYIDDLDRCTHDQVYAVLQAIHLLLAFELFVVVVGVDVRWIEGAVAKHFEADTVQSNDGTQRNGPDSGRRKRAIDYLEKIFQIPFWLERLNTGNAATSTGGSYAAYVRLLLKDNEQPEAGPRVFKSFLPSTQRPGDPIVSGKDQANMPQGTVDTPSIDQTAVAAEDEFGAVDAALASLKLEKEEIDFLASSEIGSIASKSPRAVKRLINIYRIVRARLSDQELDEFLGKSGAAPRYPIAALLAAIETGQPIELAEALYPALALLRGDARLNFIWITKERPGPDRSKEATEALLHIANTFPALTAAFAAVDRLCGKEGASVDAYLQMARLIRRYSFNRYS